jgi:Ca-activated chloride channel family protein
MARVPAARAVVLIGALRVMALPTPTSDGGSASQPAYRTQTELVRVTATVSDAAGRPVTTLQREDFTISEDDVPQDIALFSHDSDTALSIAIALDISGSMKEELDTVRAGLHEYLAGLRDDDEAGLVAFGARAHRVADLATPRTDLLAALSDLQAGGGTALYEGMVEGVRLLRAARHRKRVLLLVTDGNNTSHRASARSARRAAEQSEALVYALGIGHSGRESLRGRIVAALSGPQMGLLRAFADASGGRAELVDDINGSGREPVVQMIRTFGDELRQQYTIGYYPPAHRGSRTVHQIRVTTRVPGQTVRARKLYVASP